jgi:predicted component of type VI protein secretion system
MSEADTIKSLFELIPKRERAKFCREHDIPGGVSMVYQHINGIKPISLQAAVSYALAFNKPLEVISPRLAKIIDRLPQQSGHAFRVSEPEAAPNSAKIVAFNTENKLRKELADLAARMSDTALQVLIYEAKKIDKEYPPAQASNGN